MSAVLQIENPLTVVIVVDHGFISGGLAKVALESALGLKQAGHHPIVFAAVAPLEPRLAEAGVETLCLDQTDLLGNASKFQAMLQGTWNFAAARALAELLARLPKGRTIIHVHGWAKALSPAIAPAIAKAGHPAVMTVHEYFSFCPNGGFYNYPQGHVCTLKPLSLGCWASHCDARNYPRKLWRSARTLLMRDIARLPQVFSDYILISDFQRHIVGPYLPQSAHVHRIGNPVDVTDQGAKVDPTQGEMIFLGRISAEKGPLLFAEAARKASITPVFVGDGPMAEEVHQRFPQAKMLGWKSPQEVHGLLRAARALVFPSLWYEGQPLTVLEAKALGTPVIVADNCAAREEIADGVEGLWFDSGNADALAQALLRLGRDDDLIRRLSQNAHQNYWRDPLTLERHVRDIVRLYEEMARSSNANETKIDLGIKQKKDEN